MATGDDTVADLNVVLPLSEDSLVASPVVVDDDIEVVAVSDTDSCPATVLDSPEPDSPFAFAADMGPAGHFDFEPHALGGHSEVSLRPEDFTRGRSRSPDFRALGWRCVIETQEDSTGSGGPAPQQTARPPPPPWATASTGAMFRHILARPERDPPFLVTCSGDVDGAVDHVNRAIAGIAGRGRNFYVGISEDTGRRFEMHQDTSPNTWQRMVVLVEAPSSRATATIEQAVLRRWLDWPGCLNVGTGGERPSAGSPHFVYVLEGQGHGLIRRRAP